MDCSYIKTEYFANAGRWWQWNAPPTADCCAGSEYLKCASTFHHSLIEQMIRKVSYRNQLNKYKEVNQKLEEIGDRGIVNYKSLS